ncbi:MAG: septum formation family protein [Acidimicrobiia bacterium]|nr:septum formation family protein [Acidimicrobiia bacterium]
MTDAAPPDFAIESFPPPAEDDETEPIAPPEEPAAPRFEEPTFTEPLPPASDSRDEPASWAPPPVDPANPADWTGAAPTGPAPDETPSRGGSIARNLWILVVLAVVGFGLFSFFDTSKTVDDIAVGDCLNIPDEDIFSTIDPLDCNEPHDLEVFALIDLSVVSPEYSSIASYPGDDAVYEAAFNECWDEFELYVGVPYEESVLYLDVFTPTLEGWDERGDRIANCVLYEVNADATQLIQSNRSLRNANR